jgi:ribose 5-phosphate isomerase B
MKKPQKEMIYLGADHAGFKLKEELRRLLEKEGYPIMDVSPKYVEGDDYPLYAKQVAARVQKDKNGLGLLVCGTGHGMEMAADRFKKVRAFVAHTAKDAKLAREHNHANVIVFGGWITKRDEAKKILRAWLKAKPSRAARHVRRVKQLDT